MLCFYDDLDRERILGFMRFVALLCATALATVLTGCGDPKPIDVVTKGVFSIDKSVTLGGALNHYQNCVDKTVQWKESTSEKGATIVTFSCQLGDAPTVFRKRYAESIVAMTSEGLATLFRGLSLPMPETQGDLDEAEVLLETMLDKVGAPEAIRKTIHSTIYPYKVQEATVEIDFAIDRTNRSKFDIKEARLDLTWKDRKAVMPLYIDGTLAALYHDETVFQPDALGKRFETRLTEAWKEAAPEKPKETTL